MNRLSPLAVCLMIASVTMSVAQADGLRLTRDNQRTVDLVTRAYFAGQPLSYAEPLSKFIRANPTIVMLALGFLLMIGMTLLADGFGFHVPKGYIYSAMAFSALVEGLNLAARRARRARRRTA